MNNYVKGLVFTNLDGYENEIWPTIYYKIPEKEQKIESLNGKILTVHDVIHCYNINNPERPCIKIEVGKCFKMR